MCLTPFVCDWFLMLDLDLGSHPHGYYNVEVRCITTFLHMAHAIQEEPERTVLFKKFMQWKSIGIYFSIHSCWFLSFPQV